MQLDQELELKLKIPGQQQILSILNDPDLKGMSVEKSRRVRFESWYYDTEDSALRLSGFAYRVRLEGDRYIATVKKDNPAATGGGFSDRAEWNIDTRQVEPDLNIFGDTPVGAELKKAAGGNPLLLQFTCRFFRTIWPLSPAEDLDLEMSIDEGEILAANKSLPISEIELELKKGNVSGLLLFGAELSRKFQLLPGTESKFARGMSLLSNSPDKVVQSSRTGDARNLDSQLFCQEIIPVYIKNLLSLQFDFLDRPHERDSVRLFRIQLRKLRTMLTSAAFIYDTDDSSKWKAELKEWSDFLGEIRELDVLGKGWHEFYNSQELLLDLPSEWFSIIQEERERVTEKLRKKVMQAEFSACMFELWSWILNERHNNSEKQSATTTVWVEKKLKSGLKKLYKQYPAVQGAKINSQDLHKYRLLTKKMRYLMESCEFVWTGDSKKLHLHLKEAQDVTGRIHDVQRTASILRDKAGSAKKEDGVLLFLGWLSRKEWDLKASLPKTIHQLHKHIEQYLNA